MPADAELVLDFAAAYESAVATDRPADLAEICKERPDLIPAVEELLRDAGQLAAAGRAVTPVEPDDEPMPAALGRYELQYELGQGTFGVAFRGRDTQLNRDVAVKLLRRKWAGNEAVARRFLDEARVTAQLQHPTIPAVHELGEDPDGRPWMAMKLIRGRTLAELLRDGDPALNRLAVFEAVCQGLSYAHSRGVIHRDLKPENVMVGAFGEVQVMDWGLAKVLGTNPAATGTGEETVGTAILSDRESDGTRAGSAVGTPAYMAPEQAIGAVDKVDRRSDVFGLGGVLCRLLTGKPPFVGEDAESTRQLAAMGKVLDAFARLDACGADPELVALCKRCLSPEKADRPADAGEVATAVAALRAAADERARQAEVERARAEVTAQAERKRRRVLFAASLTVVGVLAAGVGVSAWQAARAMTAETKALDERDAKDVAVRDAVTQAAVARAVNDFFQDDILRQAGSEDQADRGFEPDPDIKLKVVLVRAAARIGERFRDQPAVEAAIRHAIGDAYRELGDGESAVVHLKRSHDIRSAVLGEDHPDTLATLTALAGAHRYQGRTDEAVKLYERAAAGWRRLPESDRTFLLTTLNDLAGAYQDADRLPEAVTLFEEVLSSRRATIGPDHVRTLTTQNNLALAYRLSNRLPDAVTMYEDVLARKRRTHRPDHPSVLLTLGNLAVAHGVAGEAAKAVALLEEVVAAERRLIGADHPDALVTRYNLAGAYLADGRLADAVTAYEFIYPNQLAKIGADHPDTRATRWQLAWVYMTRGTPEQALPHLEALARYHRADKTDPKRLTRILDRLAQAYQESARFRDAVKILEEVCDRKADESGAESAEAMASVLWLADCWTLAGRADNAERCLRNVLAGATRQRPDDWRTALVRSRLGESLVRQRKFADAEPLLLAGYEGMKARETTIPPQGRTRIPEALDRLIELYTALKKPDDVTKYRAMRAEYPLEVAPRPKRLSDLAPPPRPAR